VDCDRVQQLRSNVGLQRRGLLLDQAEPEVDVAEQATLRGLAEGRPRTELPRTAEIVQERGGKQEVAPQPRVQLGCLAADRRDADGVLEQAAGVAVVPVRRRRQRAQRGPERVVREEPVDRRS
jgi:hypothetical protein